MSKAFLAQLTSEVNGQWRSKVLMTFRAKLTYVLLAFLAQLTSEVSDGQRFYWPAFELN